MPKPLFRNRHHNNPCHPPELFRSGNYEMRNPALKRRAHGYIFYHGTQGTRAYFDHYNNVRLHRNIGYMTPAQRHSGEDKVILSLRKERLAEGKGHLK
jgi:transposase InsO family protein